MSHLEKDILKGKFGKNPQLKKEAREETAEEKIEKKTGKHVKIREMAGKMVKVSGHPVKYGSKKHKRLSEEAKIGADLMRYENN